MAVLGCVASVLLIHIGLSQAQVSIQGDVTLQCCGKKCIGHTRDEQRQILNFQC